MYLAFFTKADRDLPVLDGISADTKIVLNTPLSCDEAAEKYNIPTGTLYCLDALSIAMESRSRINMVMLGAIARACPFIPMDSIETLCKILLGKKYPALIGANLQGLKMGYEKTAEKKIPDRTASPSLAKETYIWGYKNAPIGGINTRPGSTVSNDLSPSREGYIPLFLQDRCINCGLCDSTCPDMVFQFAPGTYKGKEAMVNQGLDYRHCKGCLRCVDVCPTHALVKAEEKDYPDKPHSMPDQDLLPDSVRYQKTGANSWITSDSYLDKNVLTEVSYMSDQQQSTHSFPSSDQQQSSTQAFVKKTAAQRKLYESGNELAAYAAKQINYHIMGYYPITPSTQIAENLDLRVQEASTTSG